MARAESFVRFLRYHCDTWKLVKALLKLFVVLDESETHTVLKTIAVLGTWSQTSSLEAKHMGYSVIANETTGWFEKPKGGLRIYWATGLACRRQY